MTTCQNVLQYDKIEVKMQFIIKCPACQNRGLRIDINNGYKVVTSGRPMKDFPCVTTCTVCKRKIKYDVIKDEEIDE